VFSRPFGPVDGLRLEWKEASKRNDGVCGYFFAKAMEDRKSKAQGLRSKGVARVKKWFVWEERAG
jgi:hypothetical protein